jgi:hypothetical protein
MAASATNIVITCPLNKLISRQAYEGLSMRDAFHTMRVEGMGNMYRGVVPPLLQKGTSMGVCYGAFDFYYHALTYAVSGKVEERAATDVPTSEASWGIKAAAAILSGSTEALFTPFERMQTILQHRHYTDQFSNTIDVARKLRPYGLSEYYRGGAAILLRNGPSNAIFFLLREPVRNLLPAATPTRVDAACDSSARAPIHSAGLGSVATVAPVSGFSGAGASADAAWMTADNARLDACTRRDVRADDDGSRLDGPRPADCGTWQGAAGYAGSDRGLPLLEPAPLQASTLAAAPVGAVRPLSGSLSPGLQQLLCRYPVAWNFLRDFFSGAVLGATLSTIFYPINMAKSVMQLQIGGRHRGVRETLHQVYHERQGWRGMYRGVGGNAVRALLSWGIVNSSYEIFKRNSR